MSFFSELDIALKDKAQNKSRERISINSVGVCLNDSGKPVKLYIVDTIYACGSMDVFLLDGALDQEPIQVDACDFWALT